MNVLNLVSCLTVSLCFASVTACGVEPTSPASVADSGQSESTDGTQATSASNDQAVAKSEDSVPSDASSANSAAEKVETTESAESDPDSVTALERCSAAGLAWQTGKKTNYTSYPDPGGEECIKYNGCMWAGYFAGCNGQQSEEWVEATNIAAVFPFGDLSGHQLCVKSGETVIIVNAIDTCGDDDCDGCCTQNRGDADALIDLESFTNQRWGLIDGPVQWADLGPRVNPICR